MLKQILDLQMQIFIQQALTACITRNQPWESIPCSPSSPPRPSSVGPNYVWYTCGRVWACARLWGWGGGAGNVISLSLQVARFQCCKRQKLCWRPGNEVNHMADVFITAQLCVVRTYQDNITRIHVYFISMPVVVYILTKQLLFAVSHLCAYERQSEKDARFNVAHTRVSSCKYSSFARSSFMRLTQNSLARKRGGRRALFLRPGRIRSVRL